MTLFAQNALHHNFNEILSGSYQREPVLNNMKLEISINCSHSKCLIDPINERSVSENTRSRTTKIKHEMYNILYNSHISEHELSDNLFSEDEDLIRNIKPQEKPNTCIKCNNILNDCNCDKDETKDITSKKHIIKNKCGRPRKKSRNVPEIEYECYHCCMVFNKRWKLQKHITRVHDSNKNYVCTYCDKAFKQSYHLREHLTSHTGERNYTCSFCDKSFQRISSLRRHVRTHERPVGEKTKKTPFLCTVCGKRFPFSNGVQRHMRIHLGIRNHECNICHRKFAQSTHLHVHMRTHTGEKPFICDTCGQTFCSNASLQKHLNTHIFRPTI